MRSSILFMGLLVFVATSLTSIQALAWKCHHRCPRSVWAGRLECLSWKRLNRQRCRKEANRARKQARIKRHHAARRARVNPRPAPPRRPAPAHAGTLRVSTRVPAGGVPSVEGVVALPANSEGCAGVSAGTLCIPTAALRGRRILRRTPPQKFVVCNVSRHSPIKLAIGHYAGAGRWRTSFWHTIRGRGCITFPFLGSRHGYAWYAKSRRAFWAGRRGRRIWLCASRNPNLRHQYIGNHRNCGRQLRLPFRFTPAPRHGGVVRQNIGN